MFQSTGIPKVSVIHYFSSKLVIGGGVAVGAGEEHINELDEDCTYRYLGMGRCSTSDHNTIKVKVREEYVGRGQKV